MKKQLFKTMFVACAIAASIQFTACKGKKTDAVSADTVKTDTVTVAPVTIAADDELTNGVKDATKDFPGVTATVSNGEINLTGDITREKLQKLMMNLNALHAKKINNNLTISK
ncbi:hypothetical protein [Mucilaginibacter gilvus]|uniref:BON domain-containing protein n=1 Tax=Mucilaginibacter gilvus TaxID=2305909 RepID=A0A444MTR9_9SPHI|nr:hypothetical protein [Mucilaginibacter gilvus]RWY57053.1 hypothetical protein EPL05_00530 [Mucilaginibacter gilvus]